MNDFSKELNEISDEKFKQVKDSMIANLEKKFDNLKEESNFYFEEILKKEYNFKIRQQKTEMIDKINKQEVIEFFKLHFREKKRKFEIHFINKKSEEKFYEEFEQLKRDKYKDLVLFEDYKQLKCKSSLHRDYFF